MYNQQEYLDEQVACYQLGRKTSTLRKYAREGKIRYRKEDNIRYLYNAEDIQKMLKQRLQQIIKNHALTTNDINKTFLETALLLAKTNQEEIFIVFYPFDEKINYQLVFQSELKNIKQNYRELNFNKFINDGKHGRKDNYQIFATDIVTIIQKLQGIPSNKTPKDKINYYLKLKHTLTNVIKDNTQKGFNPHQIYQLLQWRKQLLFIFGDDSVEKQDVQIGFLIDKVSKKMVSTNLFMFSKAFLNTSIMQDKEFDKISKMDGTISSINQKMNFCNDNDLFGNIEKIENVIYEYLNL